MANQICFRILKDGVGNLSARKMPCPGVAFRFARDLLTVSPPPAGAAGRPASPKAAPTA